MWYYFIAIAQHLHSLWMQNFLEHISQCMTTCISKSKFKIDKLPVERSGKILVCFAWQLNSILGTSFYLPIFACLLKPLAGLQRSSSRWELQLELASKIACTRGAKMGFDSIAVTQTSKLPCQKRLFSLWDNGQKQPSLASSELRPCLDPNCEAPKEAQLETSLAHLQI